MSSHIYGCLAFTEEQGEFRLLQPDSELTDKVSIKPCTAIEEYVLSGVFLATLSRWQVPPPGASNTIQYFSYLDSTEISNRAKVNSKKDIYKPLNKLGIAGLVVPKYSVDERRRGSAQMWSMTKAGLHLRVQTLLDLGVTTVRAKKVDQKIAES